MAAHPDKVIPRLPTEMLARIASFNRGRKMMDMVKSGLVTTSSVVAELEPSDLTHKQLVSLAHYPKIERYLRNVAAKVREHLVLQAKSLPIYPEENTKELQPVTVASTLSDSMIVAMAYHVLGANEPILPDIDTLQLLHREPFAYILISRIADDKVKFKRHFPNPLSPRAAGQKTTVYFQDKQARLHRYDGPAMRTWYNGVLINEIWAQNGKFHRVGGPALISWHDNGSLKVERWYENGKHHRADGPALILWRSPAVKETEVWFSENRVHRDKGTAITEWDKDGVLLRECDVRFDSIRKEVIYVYDNPFLIHYDDVTSPEDLLVRFKTGDTKAMTIEGNTIFFSALSLDDFKQQIPKFEILVAKAPLNPMKLPPPKPETNEVEFDGRVVFILDPKPKYLGDDDLNITCAREVAMWCMDFGHECLLMRTEVAPTPKYGRES